MDEILISLRLPFLALRGLNVFPGLTVHFDVGRKKSIRAVEEAMRGNQEIFLVTQKDIQEDDPDQNALYQIGTVSVVKQVLRMPGSGGREIQGVPEGVHSDGAVSLRSS